MPMDRFFIAPYDTNSGLQTDVKPWLIPDEAFSEMNNAYVFRGRVRKRFGSRWLGDSQLLSRFRMSVGTLAAPVSPVPTGSGSIGQMFSIANVVFTVNALGTPANLLIANGSATTATFNTTSGAFVFAGVLDSTGVAVPTNTAIFFYPSLPVMGLLTYDTNATNNEPVIGFDTQYAYLYTVGWDRITGETTGGASTWTGDDSQFFWATTWSGANAADKIFFVTNFNENEPNFMRQYDGTNWDNFSPLITSTDSLFSARLLVVFKNRLVALNTWEGTAAPGINYQNRARYSQVGSPLDANAWRQDIPGRGNAIDAATTEAIITCEFIKDRLIVYFERSTWELVYTGNQIYPFTWQQINTELGVESTFSVIPFDKVAIGVGNVGIHACNGTNVDRIDNKIPDSVFAIHNADAGVERVYGIRDYYTETIYWAFPGTDSDSDMPYPTRVLIYNYKTGTWSFNDDSITAFGYFQPSVGITWNSTTVGWDDAVSWDSGPTQAQFRQVIAGNQEGYTFIIDADEPTNAPALQITDITIPMAGSNSIEVTAINHNLRYGDYIYLQDIVGTGNLNLLNNKIFRVNVSLFDQDHFTFLYDDSTPTTPTTIISGTYQGNGVISRVSQISIRTKEYNFYAQTGRNASIYKVDFLVDSTANGQIEVDFYISTSLDSMVNDGMVTNAIMGTSTLDTFPYPTVPLENSSIRLWHPVYFQADGEYIQFQIALNDAQMMNTAVRIADFQLHALCIHAMATSYRLQ
jgi:hypothetical protein